MLANCIIMSVPTVFHKNLNDHPLSLNGHKMSVVNSLTIKSLPQPPSNIYKAQYLNKTDVLPSITPVSRGSSAKSKIIENSLTLRNIQAGIPSLKEDRLPRESNIVCEEGVGMITKENLRFSSAPESKQFSEQSDSESTISDSDRAGDCEKPAIKEFLKDSTLDATLEKLDTKTGLSGIIETRSSVKTKRTRKKRKKRPRSKFSSRGNRSVSKQHRPLPVENVYMDTSLIKRNTEICQLEAFCSPVHVTVAPTKQRKPSVDYLQHVSSKAPSAPKFMQKRTADKLNIMERTKEFIATLPNRQNSEPPEYMKENREMIKKFHDFQTSLYGQKLTTCKPTTVTISASSECFTFRPPVVKSSHLSMSRKSLGSAPGDNVQTRSVKIFQSDKQTGDLEELGSEFPGAPPGSPVEEMFKGYEFVASMSDIRSQRAVKLRLEALQKIEKQRKEKLREEKQRLDKINQKEKVKELRKQQRREIYALNKKMTEFENRNFREFCKQNGIPCNE